MIEGYGITECSPIVTCCFPHLHSKGVGHPLPGIEICVVDPETHETLPPNTQGEVCIRGPNVFSGYIGGDTSTPFLDIQGERWYRSSDLGMVDEEGFLFLAGRIKRFVKIGGEMVSLVALEDALHLAAQEKNWISEKESRPQLALGVLENEGAKPSLILLATFPVKKGEVNRILKASGFGRIMKVSEVRQVKEIPLTGTGKVQYRMLDEMINSKPLS